MRNLNLTELLEKYFEAAVVVTGTESVADEDGNFAALRVQYEIFGEAPGELEISTKATTEGVYNPQAQRDFDVDGELYELLTYNGFETWHTGGGCFAWYKVLGKTDGCIESLMITLESSLGTWAEREQRDWTVGRYIENGTEEGWICACELTLAEALQKVNELPQPQIGEETIL